MSGLGKGISTSSIGVLLKSKGLKVSPVKIDPYLNVDAGTMNPYQHGEVFVLDDGSETDLDLGNYERFLDVNLGGDHNITTGKVYRAVIEKERRGDYLGRTVQIIPHITDEIKALLRAVGEKDRADIVLIEMGGTVGDIEGMPFLEAVRQLGQEVGKENVLYVHTTLVPVMGAVGEQKTKPTQQSVRELRASGIQPNVIIARGERSLEPDVKKKIAFFSDVPVEGVISAPDASSIYDVPLLFDGQGLTEYILKTLNLPVKEEDLKQWKAMLERLKHPEREVTIALVGKYTHLKDSYISHIEAFHHASAASRIKVNLRWVESMDIEKKGAKLLEGADGILVPIGDPVALAEAAALLLRDPALAAGMGRAGRERILLHFRRKDVWNALLREYVELLGRKGLPLPRAGENAPAGFARRREQAKNAAPAPLKPLRWLARQRTHPIGAP